MKKKRKPRCKVNVEQQQENNKLRNRMNDFIVRSPRSTSVHQSHEMAAILQVPVNADVITKPIAPNAAKIESFSESTSYLAGFKKSSREDELR